MSTVYLYGGKVLVVGGKVAVGPGCCCAPPSCLDLTDGDTALPTAIFSMVACVCHLTGPGYVEAEIDSLSFSFASIGALTWLANDQGSWGAYILSGADCIRAGCCYHGDDGSENIIDHQNGSFYCWIYCADGALTVHIRYGPTGNTTGLDDDSVGVLCFSGSGAVGSAIANTIACGGASYFGGGSVTVTF